MYVIRLRLIISIKISENIFIFWEKCAYYTWSMERFYIVIYLFKRFSLQTLNRGCPTNGFFTELETVFITIVFGLKTEHSSSVLDPTRLTLAQTISQSVWTTWIPLLVKVMPNKTPPQEELCLSPKPVIGGGTMIICDTWILPDRSRSGVVACWDCSVDLTMGWVVYWIRCWWTV